MWVTTSRRPLEKDRKERSTTFCMMQEMLSLFCVEFLLLLLWGGGRKETTTCLAIFKKGETDFCCARCFVLHQVGRAIAGTLSRADLLPNECHSLD